MKTGSEVSGCCNHLNDKAQRLADREALIDQAKNVAADPQGLGAEYDKDTLAQLDQAANDLGRLNTDVRYAEASEAAYLNPDSPYDAQDIQNAPAQFTSGQGGAPEGMIRMNSPEYINQLPEGLQDPTLWSNDKSGYQAQLYYDELTGQYIAAYRGTDTSPLGELGKDAEADAAQALGLRTTQYDEGMTLGVALKDNAGFFGEDPNNQKLPYLVMAGHSLGGGIGSAAGTVAQIPFFTYNSAGLHENTVSRFTNGALSNADGASLGTRYYTLGDPLTIAQNIAPAVKFWLFGSNSIFNPSISKAVPSALGNTVYPIGSMSDGHSILGVVQAMENQKKTAQDTISSILYPSPPSPPIPDDVTFNNMWGYLPHQ
jgi:hypothetical protein